MRAARSPGSGRLVRTGVALLCLAASAVVLAGPPQTFRSSVDVIPVDVQVLDANGRPIGGLQASDFEVQIDRRARRVLSADFRQYKESERSVLPPGPLLPPPAADAAKTGEPPRIFVLAVDAASLSDHESSGLVRALEGFVARLPATDAVGFFTLPHGPSLRPTTSRATLRKVIGGMVAGQGLRASPLNLSPVEMVEIVSSPANPSGPVPTTARGRAAAVNPDDMLRQFQMKECGNANDRACTTGILAEAETYLAQLEQEVYASLRGIKALLAGLRDYDGPKTVVLASAGMPLSDRPGGWHSSSGEARTIGEEAARSRVSIYSMHVDRGLSRTFAPEVEDVRSTTSRSREIEERVLYRPGGNLGRRDVLRPRGLW